MEPQYSIPFPSDARSTFTWSTPDQSARAIATPDQQFRLLHPPDAIQDRRSTLKQSSAAVQQHGLVKSTHLPSPLLSHNGHPHPCQFQYVQMPRTPVTPSYMHTRRPQLPVPPRVLPSQSKVQEPCLACKRPGCALASHRYYSKYVRDQKERDGQSELTPRPATAMLARPLTAYGGPVMQPPFALDLERQHLLALWSEEWSPVKQGYERHLFPAKFINRVLPVAQNHMPLLQALLAYSGTIWAIANNMLSDAISRQQALAVEMLSQACPTESEASTDQGVLAATLLLLIYLAQGNSFEVGKHVSGLVHLTRVRGGPHYLGLSGVVAETLIHADYMQAIFFNHEPVWHFPLPQLEFDFPEKMGQGFRKVMSVQGLDASLSATAQSVCKVADIFKDASSGISLAPAVKHAYGYLAMMAEYQLARCNAAYHASSTPSECICLALVLFNHVVLNNDGAVTPSIMQIEHRFWQALEAAEYKGLMHPSMPICLHMWIILTGLTVGTKVPSRYRSIGVEKLRATRITSGIVKWEQVKANVLDKYVWLPYAQEEAFRGIWLEVEGLKSDNGNSGRTVPEGRKLDVLPPAG
ncbi:hypothetical protein LTR64_002972 [Lithohypha guttulata]|uniref:uncharacterized protein n=1 Tax=Lithohypha guttulata TaxID=1690604 RepID=UPI00315D8F73